MATAHPYPIPPGCHAIPYDLLDPRPDTDIDHAILNPSPITDVKNIWFFWHSGYETMHGYTKRNIRAYHRRFSKQGWKIRVVDQVPNSPSNIATFLNMHDPNIFPKAFREGTLDGDYAKQHCSDLVRFPLLLQYGGAYADAGLLQIGNLDALWNETIENPTSPYTVLSYNAGSGTNYNLTNYFLASGPHNPFFQRCHDLLLALWAQDGGKTNTTGMHTSPLLAGVSLNKGAEGEGFTITNPDGSVIPADECAKLLSDYIIQGQVMTAVMGLKDPETGWNGPEFTTKQIYGIEYMQGSQLINAMTAWNGQKAFELMSLPLPESDEAETDAQTQARQIVEACLSKSFGFKLAHGLIIRAFGETLGSLWRANPGSDVVEGTYAHWLRYGMTHFCPDELPRSVVYELKEPSRVGRLLG
ncbi:hypothetical protein EJ03DRAFT_328590 [Teratosphaeria nubilosa]|uniref:Capsule polysaccharide biosynthesis protein n=1 Tax=Teratosphaeria nubilosa TaxID=161662 RepID=A0A6G1L715_9PEZI|nr:hypothetical protein EJ03DRAFT_328590 [Teratosphaeria nubilosa]